MPLVSEEEKTDAMQALFRRDRNLVISFITPIEVTAGRLLLTHAEEYRLQPW